MAQQRHYLLDDPLAKTCITSSRLFTEIFVREGTDTRPSLSCLMSNPVPLAVGGGDDPILLELSGKDNRSFIYNM